MSTNEEFSDDITRIEGMISAARRLQEKARTAEEEMEKLRTQVGQQKSINLEWERCHALLDNALTGCLEPGVYIAALHRKVEVLVEDRNKWRAKYESLASDDSETWKQRAEKEQCAAQEAELRVVELKAQAEKAEISRREEAKERDRLNEELSNARFEVIKLESKLHHLKVSLRDGIDELVREHEIEIPVLHKEENGNQEKPF